MDNIRDILPIGSVVMLEGAKRPIMIFGVMQSNSETKIDYDYIGVIYPEGNLGGKSQLLFNHKDIKEVLFKGFETEDRKMFVDKLAEYYEKQVQK